jgi:hypothetical protein
MQDRRICKLTANQSRKNSAPDPFFNFKLSTRAHYEQSSFLDRYFFWYLQRFGSIPTKCYADAGSGCNYGQCKTAANTKSSGYQAAFGDRRQ